MSAKPDVRELVEVAGTFHNDSVGKDGKPDPPRPWGKVWKGWLETKVKLEEEKA